MKAEKRCSRGICFLLTLVLTFTMWVSPVTLYAQTNNADTTDIVATVKSMYQATGDYLYQSNTNPTVGSIGGDWVILGLARAGFSVDDDYYVNYYANV